MRFSLTKEQNMLRNSFSEFLRSKCTSEERKKWLSSEDGYSKSIWKNMASLGWPGLIFDEKYGGMNGSFIEFFILFEEIGAFLLPSPLFASSVMAGILIQISGNEKQKEEHIPGLVSGKRIYTLACFDEKGYFLPDGTAVKAISTGNGSFQLSGTCIFVPYPKAADKILLCANLSDSKICDAPTLFLINPKRTDLKIIDLRTLSHERQCAIDFNEVMVSEEDMLGEIGCGNSYLECLRPKLILIKCAEMIGGMKKVLDMTVDYAKNRHQFKRPIGSFQIIKNYCTDIATDLEIARLLAYNASTLVDRKNNCVKEVAMAKAWCSDAFSRCCLLSHQIHGAYGFTEECDLHLYTKNAKTLELLFGHSWFHRRIVASNLGL